MNTGNRLKKLRKSLILTQLQFAQALGYDATGYFSELERGEKKLSSAVQRKIKEVYPRVNINWLMTGEGEMFLEKKVEVGKDGSSGLGAVEDDNSSLVVKFLGIMEDIEQEMESLRKEVDELKKWRETMSGK